MGPAMRLCHCSDLMLKRDRGRDWYKSTFLLSDTPSECPSSSWPGSFFVFLCFLFLFFFFGRKMLYPFCLHLSRFLSSTLAITTVVIEPNLLSLDVKRLNGLVKER